MSVRGQQSVPSLLFLRLFGIPSEGCGEEKVLSMLLWCPTPRGGECLAHPCWCSVEFLCGKEISSRWMKGFETVTQLGLGGGKEGKGDTCIQEFAFVIGKGLGNIPYALENRC